ncbi:MAG: hypothetical protein JRE23_16655 [Deltaproteobacteria bacterium]|nr:hypothetical protein [Deltaproteobacteria bacterium]
MEAKAEVRKDFFEMSNSCSCEDEEGNPTDCYGDCWECDLDYLNTMVGAEGCWKVAAEQIGWTNYSAEGVFEVDNPEDWIRKVVGFDCAWTFRILSMARIEDEVVSLIAKVYHHDSPTGEPRFVTRIDSDAYDAIQLAENPFI